MTRFHGKISPQSWMIAPETVRVMQALQADNYNTRFVGGCVRDTLANRKVVDIDIATALLPDDVMDCLTAAGIHYVPTGLQHGTITAIVDSHPFEITTLRLDRKTDGRHAEVRFTDDWEKDAARRDFTFNAMSATVDGDIFDPFGGLQHLREGKVIFVGDPDKRITEDYLRILRYFRFLAQFGRLDAPLADHDTAALAACAKHAKNMGRLSAERLRQETLKILESDRCAAVWNLMLSHRVATHFLPEAMNIAVLEKLVALEAAHHSAGSSIRRLAAVLDIDDSHVPQITRALRLSNEQTARLAGMKKHTRDFTAATTDQQVRRAVYQQGADLTRSALLLAAANGVMFSDFQQLYTVATSFSAPRFPLEGNDVLALGVAVGSAVGRYLATVETWWIESDFQPGRTDCLEKLKSVTA